VVDDATPSRRRRWWPYNEFGATITRVAGDAAFATGNANAAAAATAAAVAREHATRHDAATAAALVGAANGESRTEKFVYRWHEQYGSFYDAAATTAAAAAAAAKWFWPSATRRNVKPKQCTVCSLLERNAS